MKTPSNHNNPLKTILIITAGFMILYWITQWRWAILAATIIALAGLVSGYLAEKIEWCWMKLSWLLSFIIPNILLTIIFYFFLTPVALLSRVFGKKNPLGLKNTDSSFFIDCKTSRNKRFFEKPW